VQHRLVKRKEQISTFLAAALPVRVNRRTDLPSEARVRATLTRLRQRATETGQRLTVLALAREFGLSNTAFRRHFAYIVRDIADASQPDPHEPPASTSRYDRLVARMPS